MNKHLTPLVTSLLLVMAAPAGAQGSEPEPAPTSETEVQSQPEPGAESDSATEPVPGAESDSASDSDPDSNAESVSDTQPTPAAAPVSPEPPRSERLQLLRVAVYDFAAEDIDERTARVVTESVLAELRKLEGLGVIGMDEVRAMLDLEAQKQLLGCDDESCLADIAGALGADVLIIGTLAKVGQQHVFGMRRIDQRTASVVGTVNQTLEPAGGEEFLAMVGPAVEELFPDKPLRAGAERGVSKELGLRLNPPPLDPWVFWSSLGLTASLGTATAALGVASFASWLDYDAYLQSSQERVIAYATVKQKGDLNNVIGIAAWSGVAVTVLAATATGASYFFVDWDNLRGEE